MSNRIQNESHAGARDNVVGAIARLISTNFSILPLDQIFPVFLNQLPLTEDFEEHKAVFESILTLYKAGHEVLKPHITALINVASTILREKKYNDDGEYHLLYFGLLKNFSLKDINHKNLFSFEVCFVS